MGSDEGSEGFDIDGILLGFTIVDIIIDGEELRFIGSFGIPDIDDGAPCFIILIGVADIPSPFSIILLEFGVTKKFPDDGICVGPKDGEPLNGPG